MPPTAHTPSRAALFTVLPVLLTVLAPVSLAGVAPEIAFEPTAVVAHGITPGSDVVVHGVTRERHAYLWRLVSTREVVVADDAGAARLDLPDGVGPVSIWTAVDATTGAFSIASPEGFEPEELAFPDDGLDRNSSGAWRRLRSRFERAEVLYVRPGVGAWWLLGTDGSASDDDEADDSALAVSLDAARPLWRNEPPPDGFAAGDVVVTVSLDTLDFFAARLVPPGAER